MIRFCACSPITRRVLASVLAAGVLCGATPVVDDAEAKPKPTPTLGGDGRKN